MPFQRTKKLLRRTATIVALCLLLLWSLSGWLVSLIPLPSTLAAPRAADLELVDRHGTPLRDLHATNGFHGRIASLQEVSTPLINATLAAEDRRFWQHHGVDWRASSRALLGFIRNGRVISGGSTISQQVIKLAAPRPRTLRTKLIEAAQAMRLEQCCSKATILTEYLNRLDYGHCRFGIVAAADFYFGKLPADLSDAEAALLAGLPQSPSRLDPHVHLARAKRRQEWILSREVAAGHLTADVARRTMAEPLRFREPRGAFRAPHFVDLLLQREPRPKSDQANAVHTTLDLALNDFAQETLRAQLARLRQQSARDGAIVVLENRTGNVLALVGSADYSAAAGQVNGAWAPRSAGSTFKPFTYLLALEHGATPASIVPDLPVEFPTKTGVFAPLNYDRRCYGPMSYRLALANSLNISAVRVLDSIGGPEILRRQLENCGLTTLNHPADFYGLGLTIGNAEARLLELANAYACIARLGEYKPVRLTTTSSNPPNTRVFATDASYLIADILSDNFARQLAFGAHSSLHFDFPVACKTGTSSDFRDNWALGFTPEFTVGVWIGNFDGSPMHEVSGVSGAAPILHEIFEELHERFGTTWFAPPTNIIERWVNPLNGHLATAHQPDAVREKFIAGKIPPPASADDFDGSGRVKLPVEYRDWLASGQNWLHDKVSLETSTGQPSAQSLRIVSPAENTAYFLDPDLPNHGRHLRLQANTEHGVIWHCATLPLQQTEHGTIVILKEGRHELVVRNVQTGAESRTWISVKPL